MTKIPRKREPVRNRKDKLFNDVIDFLVEHKLSYSPAEAESCRKKLVNVLTDCLWHVDGSHDTLKAQSCPIPTIISRFGGYNTPEHSKHRKRNTSNLSSDTLKALSRSLFPLLHRNYWKRTPWLNFGKEVESVAGSMAQYADKQNKRSKLQHVSDIPVRQLSDYITLTYVKATTASVFPIFRELSDKLEGIQLSKHLF